MYTSQSMAYVASNVFMIKFVCGVKIDHWAYKNLSSNLIQMQETIIF